MERPAHLSHISVDRCKAERSHMRAAIVRLRTGIACQVELRWYEAHGIGRKKFKIKHFLE